MKERRLIHLFKEVGSNAKTWWEDTTERYVGNPIRDKDPIQIALGIPAAAWSTVTELPDYIYGGIVDEKITPPNDEALLPRTSRDIGDIIRNNVRHPLRTLLAGLRIIGDLPMDAIHKVGGFRR